MGDKDDVGDENLEQIFPSVAKQKCIKRFGFFLLTMLQLHTADRFMKIFPVRNILGNLFVKLFGMVLVFDVSQLVNDDIINRCKG